MEVSRSARDDNRIVPKELPANYSNDTNYITHIGRMEIIHGFTLIYTDIVI
jgi:hypothetical protein